jgi:ActR/RegA family two-component response regulator
MFLSTDQIKCLVVEDDKFKLDSIRQYLHDTLPGKVAITECHALSTATAELAAGYFDIVIIDMSIHSHEPEAGAGSPVPLPSGGLDVLFEVNHLNHDSLCIILTQYTDIEIEGLPVAVEFAAAEIELKFGIKVAGCVQYFENDTKWKSDICKILEKM